MNKYKVELNESQVELMSRALDFYSRILALQFREINNVLMDAKMRDPKSIKEITFENIRNIADEMEKLKDKYTDLSQHESNGITNESTPEEARVAYDMFKVLVHRISWDNHPEGGFQTYFDTPMHYGNEDLIKIEKINTEEN